MSYPESRLQRNYVQVESACGTIPNSSGAATLAGTDAFLCMNCDMKPGGVVNKRPDKTGSLSQIAGTPGRRSGTWSMRCSLAGSGSAGTAPDIDAFLQAAFGKAGSVSAGASVTYALEDASPSLTIWDFNALAAADQQVAMASIVARAKFEIGGDFAYADFSGESKYVLRKDNFANEDSTAKSGLTAFPSEPGTRTVAGASVAGYKGTITLDGQTYTTLRSGSLELAVARVLPKDVWNSDYPGAVSSGVRVVTVALSLYDDDSANLLALKNKATNNTAVDLSLVVGVVAGNIWAFNCKNVLFEKPGYEYGESRRIMNLTGEASASSVSAKDELSLVIT